MTNPIMYPLSGLYDIIVNPDGLYDYTTVEAALASILLGDSTTQFDITNPAGDTLRYTYDGTGADPEITPANLRAGRFINLQAQNFNAANNGFFLIDAVGADYFDITNTSGVAENNVTIGTGHLNRCVRMYLRGYFEPADHINFYGGCFYDSTLAILSLAADKKVHFPDDRVQTNGALTVIGEGDSSAFYGLVIIDGDYISINDILEVSPSSMTITDHRLPVVNNGDHNTLNLFIASFTTEINGGAYSSAAFQNSGERNMINFTSEGFDMTGTSTGITVGVNMSAGGDHNNVIVNIDGILNTAGGTGTGIDIAADRCALSGVISGCKTATLTDSGANNVSAGLVTT